MDYVNILLGLFFTWFLVNGLMSLRRRKISKKLPPGPFPLPIIGNLHLLGNHPHKSLAQLAKIHGPIMNLKLGQLITVVISSSVVAREVLQKQDLTFSNRFVPDVVHVRNHSDFSFVWLPVNSRWRTLRKIMNSSIFSGNKLDGNQHLRSKKVQELIDYCQKCAKNGEAVDIGRATFGTTLNLLSNTIFSKDLTNPFSDSAKEFKELVWNIMVEAWKTQFGGLLSFPLRKFDPQGIKRRMTNYFTKFLGLISGLIDERLKERNLRDNANIDVLDALLNISKRTQKRLTGIKSSSCLVSLFPTPFLPFIIICPFLYLLIFHRCKVSDLNGEGSYVGGRVQLNHTPLQIGCDRLTVSNKPRNYGDSYSSFRTCLQGLILHLNTLEWANGRTTSRIHTLLAKKHKKTISQHICTSKKIKIKKLLEHFLSFGAIVKKNLPIPPGGFSSSLFHVKWRKTLSCLGYIIPKDSQVLVSVWAIGRNSDLWENPLVFKPERFWESEIDIRGRDFELIPFGAGRRICPGLPLAIRMIPVALGSLLNSFNWKLYGGIAPKDLDMEEKFGITLAKAQPLLAIPTPL
uniref:Lauric acid 10-hydroxylase n=1 Tax=Petunia hybrida TaxID=4102 RepID=C76B9_PETHY|nr:RecName: Full=Lauric acid 10-hydroxylase; AltName: Full=Capric acid 12-hydroxylase; AltName: Full=Cytochrome P450 76B9 [Petunia x hybrida]BAE97672.1 CYP76J1 [Petunia x hybrida]